MNDNLKKAISCIQNALFEGRFVDAVEKVEHLRRNDPHLQEFGAALVQHMHTTLGLFSFRSLSTNTQYIKQETFQRQKLVLSWLNLSDQLNLFGIIIDNRDVCLDIIDCLKFEQLNSSTRKQLTTVVAHLLADKKIDEAKRVMQLGRLSMKDTCNHIYMLYTTNSGRGGLTMTNVKDVPLYTVLAFNYTDELFDVIQKEGITHEEIQSTFKCVECADNEYGRDILQQYKCGRFLELKAKVEQLTILESLKSIVPNGSGIRKKM